MYGEDESGEWVEEMVECPDCGGNGDDFETDDFCEHCHGTGEVSEYEI